jgi:hypothetical protein
LETLSPNLQQALTFLAYTSIAILIILTVFIIRLLMDLSNLAKSLHNLSIIVGYELEPLIKELKKILENINSVANGADKQVDNIKKLLTGLIVPMSDFVEKAKGLSSGLLGGLIAGLKIFLKDKK